MTGLVTKVAAARPRGTATGLSAQAGVAKMPLEDRPEL